MPSHQRYSRRVSQLRSGNFISRSFALSLTQSPSVTGAHDSSRSPRLKPIPSRVQGAVVEASVCQSVGAGEAAVASIESILARSPAMVYPPPDRPYHLSVGAWVERSPEPSTLIIPPDSCQLYEPCAGATGSPERAFPSALRCLLSRSHQMIPVMLWGPIPAVQPSNLQTPKLQTSNRVLWKPPGCEGASLRWSLFRLS
ncbi:hypothetical protein P280DRAFT_231540 [Massarina eburnea CBS 473.64]|uniref:Uncharacterized protein n=1 Tax=Massarina eburnea CBS 473.64 TaxID=1395130 RepID=A0A6A6SDY2_9PLEO|nr:hypothetical protein P280DRAFT_231540 [Massarina eburnea CBS 473.64]